MTPEAHAILTRFERGLVSKEELELASALDCGLERSAETARIGPSTDLVDRLRQAGPRCAVAAALGAARRVVGILERAAIAPEAARDALARVERWTESRNSSPEPAARDRLQEVVDTLRARDPGLAIDDPRENASLALVYCVLAVEQPELLFHSVEGSISWASLALRSDADLFAAMRAEILRALATSR